MKTIQVIRVKSNEVVGLDCCEATGLIRLSCGSNLTIDTRVLKQLLAIPEKENKLHLETLNG